MNHNITNSLIDTLKSSKLSALATDLIEAGMDQMMSDGFLKDLPIFGSLQQLYKMSLSIKDALFLKKLSYFLYSMSSVSSEERTKLIEKLEADEKYSQNVGEKILMLLERADDFLKPSIIAEAFKAYMTDKLSYDQLQRINYAVNHLQLADLEEFRGYHRDSNQDLEESTRQNLQMCGLVILVPVMGGGTEIDKITDLGQLFVTEVLEKFKVPKNG